MDKMLVDPDDVGLFPLDCYLSFVGRHVRVVMFLDQVSDHMPAAIELDANRTEKHLDRFRNCLQSYQLAFFQRDSKRRDDLPETYVFLHCLKSIQKNCWLAS